MTSFSFKKYETSSFLGRMIGDDSCWPCNFRFEIPPPKCGDIVEIFCDSDNPRRNYLLRSRDKTVNIFDHEFVRLSPLELLAFAVQDADRVDTLGVTPRDAHSTTHEGNLC